MPASTPKAPPTIPISLQKAIKKMDPSRGAKVTSTAQSVPKTYLSAYTKAVKGRSLRAAVDAMCQQCCGYEREEVRKCTSTDCPLWAYRPYKET